jgi:hypothetical protein
MWSMRSILFPGDLLFLLCAGKDDILSRKMPAIAVRGKGEEGQHLRVEMPAGTVERGGRTLCVGEKRRKDSLCWPYLFTISKNTMITQEKQLRTSIAITDSTTSILLYFEYLTTDCKKINYNTIYSDPVGSLVAVIASIFYCTRGHISNCTYNELTFNTLTA